jgi:hypothetical protein|tara:strand:- start:166 stop:777 length:612 start_codon:yes stop_codon:yes gene_type:complete
MKKLLVLLFSLFFSLLSSTAVAKEYKTIFQFSVNIPKNYIGVNDFNLDDVTNILKSETDVNISAWKSLLQDSGIKKGEIFYNINDLENLEIFTNNINLIRDDSSYYKVLQNDLIEFCPDYEKMLTSLANKKVTQLQCSISSNPGLKGYSIYMEHIGMMPDITTIQYLFWISNSGMIAATLTCDFYNCAEDRVVFKNLVSSIKY